MSKKQNSMFSVQINPFDGTPSYAKFFFSLIKESSKINQWTNDQTILFLKSKLTGPALKFLLENDNLMLTNDINLIQAKFLDFFAEKSSTSAFTDFNNLNILPEESIKHFSHRLNVITKSAYPNVIDQSALDSIKLNKFFSVLPTNLRIKLREEKINDFQLAVSRGQELQDIMQHELLTHTSSTHCINTISANIADLSSKIDSLTQQKHDTTTHENNVSERNSYNQHSHRNNFKARRFSRANNFSFPRNRGNHNVVCQLCFKNGHKANVCFKYVNARQQTRQYTTHCRPRGRFNNNIHSSRQENLN
jgi:hypothetical protein